MLKVSDHTCFLATLPALQWRKETTAHQGNTRHIITENFHVNASRMIKWTGLVADKKQSSAEDVFKVKLGNLTKQKVTRI